MPISGTEENIEEMKQSPLSLEQLVLTGCTTRPKKSAVIFIEQLDPSIKSVKMSLSLYRDGRLNMLQEPCTAPLLA